MNGHDQNASPASVLYCIGDSHVSFFSGVDRIQPNWPDEAECHISFF